jgi:hypothetical protein
MQQKDTDRVFPKPTQLQVYLKYNRMAINFLCQKQVKRNCIKSEQFLYQK